MPFQILCCLAKRLGFGQSPAPKPPPSTTPNPATGQRNVVILGGGVSGVAAAFWLSDPQLNGRFRITLYTQGWRLGGKCASGRNQANSNAIEEHGLHLLMGCYQNAFTTIRACYDVWTRPVTHPFQSWQDAFLPQRSVTLMEQDGPGNPPTWAAWDFPNFFQFPGNPGDLMSATTFFTPANQTTTSMQAQAAPAAVPAATSAVHAPRLTLADLVLRMTNLLRTLELPVNLVSSYQEALTSLQDTVRSPATDQALHTLQLLSSVNEQFAREFQQAASAAMLASTHLATALSSATLSHRLLMLASIGLAIGYGYVRDILPKGEGALDALNNQDFRTWLKSCHAADEALDSAPIRAIYDLAFAFVGGDASTLDNGSMAAGVTIRFALEITFGYRNAPLWRMAAGTGDTVFVPLYQVLKERGVNVQFFHRVTGLRPTADSASVGEIDLSRQVATVGSAPYQPLIEVGNISSWPNQPDWKQLVCGGALRIQRPDYESTFCTNSVDTVTLKAGADFDVAIVAMPPAVLNTVAAPLIAASQVWRTAMSQSDSVATGSLQLWMSASTEDLGWPYGPAVLSAFAEPYDSWGDMSVVLSYESWPSNTAPAALAYFCGCLQLPANGPIDPATMLQLAKDNGDQWLATNIRFLWPNVPAVATWPQTGANVARYDKANFDLSDLYVQTPAGGNVQSRFRSNQTAGFDNLYVVGDWTRTRFSGGCFESAIESAMLAANRIGGFPPIDEIQTS